MFSEIGFFSTNMNKSIFSLYLSEEQLWFGDLGPQIAIPQMAKKDWIRIVTFAEGPQI